MSSYFKNYLCYVISYYNNNSLHLYMIKTKVDFLESRLFFSQSGLFENYLDCSYWLDKSRPSKKSTFV